MAQRRKIDQKDQPPRQPPAQTLEGRESQMISLAVDLAERRLREGTASSQEIVHYLRLGSTREKIEQERLRQQTSLLVEQAKAMESAQRVEELYTQALDAMRSYSGTEEDNGNERRES